MRGLHRSLLALTPLLILPSLGFGQCEVFRDDMNGSTQFTEHAQPFGDPHNCAHPDFCNFGNNGNEHYINTGCYDEGELRKSFALPNSTYAIKVKWRAGTDGFQYTACDHTNLDGQYGASCQTPKRLIVVNNNLQFELDGQNSGYATTTTVNFTGAINEIRLTMGSSGSSTPYHTYYDYVSICDMNATGCLTAPTSASASPSSFCGPSANVSLSQSGGSGTGSYTYEWYSGSCGGTHVGTGSSINVTTNSTTTYYVRVENGCGNTSCESVTVQKGGSFTDPSSASASPSAICPGDSTTLSVSGGSIAPSATWEWYSGSCGGTSVGSGDSLTVQPGGSTTYYVRGEGSCDSTACESVTINMATSSTGANSASASPSVFCAGDSSTLSKTGGSLGVGGSWEWYSGSCGGTHVGSGASLDVAPSTNTTYYLRAEGSCDTTNCVSTSVTVSPSPTLNAGPDLDLCMGDTVTLSSVSTSGGTTPYSFNWNNAGSLSNSTIQNPEAFPSSTTTYIVTVTDPNGCSDTDTVTVNVHPKPSVSFTGLDASYCSNAPQDTLIGSEAPNGTFSGNGVTDLGNGVALFDPSGASPGTHDVLYSFTSSNGCSDSDTQSVVIEDAPDLDDSNLLTINATCGDSNGSIQNMAVNGGNTPYFFQWKDVSGTTVGNSLDLTQQPSGSYSLTVVDANGCRDSLGPYTIGNIGGPTANAGASDTVCQWDSVQLGGNPSVSGGSAPYDYDWDPANGLGDTSVPKPKAAPLQTRTYTLTVTDSNDCQDRDSVTVHILPAPQISSGHTFRTCATRPITIGGNPTAQGSGPPFIYHWGNAATLSDDSIPNPVASPVQNTSYPLLVTDTNGCSATDTARVLIDKRHCAGPHIFIPNAFSPNGDGRNDELKVKGKDIASFTLVIYNRWGEKVFTTSSKSNGWDGRYGGEELDPAVFVYKVSGAFENGQHFEKKGNITLLK